MKQAILMNAVAALTSLAFMGSSSAEPSVAAPKAAASVVKANTPSKCLSELHALSSEMRKQGYWMGSSDYGFGYGYGYPMGLYGYGYGEKTAAAGGDYATARPGYEVRTLMASARILARLGQEAECGNVLQTAKTGYERYVAELHDKGFSSKNRPDVEQRLIATAQPVTSMSEAFRSDQLIDAQVVNPAGEALGSVHDLVTNPTTGTVAYVVIESGGLFGIDAAYAAVPWDDFKASANANILVLDTTKSVVAAAPQGGDDQFTKSGGFEAQKQKIDAYWKTHVKLASAAN